MSLRGIGGHSTSKAMFLSRRCQSSCDGEGPIYGFARRGHGGLVMVCASVSACRPWSVRTENLNVGFAFEISLFALFMRLTPLFLRSESVRCCDRCEVVIGMEDY